MSVILKDEYVERIKKDPALQGAIAQKTGKSIQAPKRWADKNRQDKLTMLSTLNAISEFTGVAVEYLVTESIAA